MNHYTTPNRAYYETPAGRRAYASRKLENMDVYTETWVCGKHVTYSQANNVGRPFWTINGRRYYTLKGAVDALTAEDER